MFIAVEIDQFQGIADFIFDILTGFAVDFGTEGDIICHIHMGKQCIILKHRIHLAAVGRHMSDILSVKQDNACIRFFKPADEPKCRRLATAARPQKCYEFIFINRQVQAIQYEMTIKRL